jgi:hypothetical protein
MASHRETDDDYGKVIIQFTPKARLIECADGIQWILQQRRSTRWLSVKFFTSRDGVLRRVREYRYPGEEALAVLPDRYRRWPWVGPGPELPLSATPIAGNPDLGPHPASNVELPGSENA